MPNWVQKGIEGQDLKSVLKLYCVSIIGVGFICLIIALLFGSEYAFRATPSAAVFITGLVYLIKQSTTHSFATDSYSLPSIPWLQLRNVLPQSTATRLDLEASKWINRGLEIAEESSRWDAAIKCYNNALEINPGIPEAWSNKAVALWYIGNQAGALACFNTALEVSPLSPELWFNKALLSWMFGSYQRAVTQYSRALEINPKIAEPWQRVGILLDEDPKQIEKALAFYVNDFRDNPTPSEIWVFKGQLLLDMHRYAEALMCFRKAAQLGDSRAVPKIEFLKGLLGQS